MLGQHIITISEVHLICDYKTNFVQAYFLTIVICYVNFINKNYKNISCMKILQKIEIF